MVRQAHAQGAAEIKVGNPERDTAAEEYGAGGSQNAAEPAENAICKEAHAAVHRAHTNVSHAIDAVIGAHAAAREENAM